MRTFSTVCLCVICFAPQCLAQMSVNPDWRERNGLTVASSQTVSVAATKLRGFASLEFADTDPRNALAKLKAMKKSALEALKAIDVPETSVKVTASKILEWESTPKNVYYFQSNGTGLLPTTESSEYTAIAYISFDIPLVGIDPDEFAILPHDICKRLRRETVFDSKPIVMLYVGVVNESQVTDATKKAYDEAFAKAKSIASLSGRSLGKLAALTPEMEGRSRYWSNLTYGNWNDESTEKKSLSNFSPAENEVFGNDALKLTRTISIELRFDIE